MNNHPILGIGSLGARWPTLDPFLFCVHHRDAYPTANGAFGPQATLAGRNIGQDFAGIDGWNMYHGEKVPGFPAHPHRGFETVTLVRQGVIDHSDSLGAAARFGAGDTQWLTAGRGIVHSEMFPLLNQQAPNPLELFQIWLNLPARSKMANPYFTMFWADDIPKTVHVDRSGRSTCMTHVAGAPRDRALQMPAPPPDSWASQVQSGLAIWTLHMEPGAELTLAPASDAKVNRCLYFFRGPAIDIAGKRLDQHAAIQLRADHPVSLVNGESAAEFLLLQGRPIGEPVVQYGPFVMNTREEIEQAFADYRHNQFGGWPWPAPDPVHQQAAGRFARHANGTTEYPASRSQVAR